MLNFSLQIEVIYKWKTLKIYTKHTLDRFIKKYSNFVSKFRQKCLKSYEVLNRYCDNNIT